MYEITHITVSQNPPTLGTITSYYFQGRNNEASMWVLKPAAVDFVSKNPSYVYVAGGGTSAFVEVVPNGASPYLRTISDKSTKDNLLSLPISA